MCLRSAHSTACMHDVVELFILKLGLYTFSFDLGSFKIRESLKFAEVT